MGSLRSRLLRLEHHYVVAPPGATENEPPLTNAQLAEMMRQYHEDPTELSDMNRQRCAAIDYVTNPHSVGFRPAMRAALGL